MVPDILWKQGNLYHPKSDEAQVNIFPNLPKNAILIHKIPGFSEEKESDICNIPLKKVEGRSLNLFQRDWILDRIAEKKICKTASDLKNDFDAIGFYRDRLKFMVFITHFGIFIPKRLDFGNSNGPVYMQRLSDYVYGDIEYVCVYIDDILTTVQAIEKLFREVFQMTRDAQLRIAVYEVRFLVLIMWDSTLQKMGSNSKRSMLCSSRCQDY